MELLETVLQIIATGIATAIVMAGLARAGLFPVAYVIMVKPEDEDNDDA